MPKLFDYLNLKSFWTFQYNKYYYDHFKHFILLFDLWKYRVINTHMLQLKKPRWLQDPLSLSRAFVAI